MDERLTEWRDDLNRYEYKQDEKGYCWIQEGQIVQKLGKLEAIEKEFGIGLDVLFKALKDGIYDIKENTMKKINNINLYTISYSGKSLGSWDSDYDDIYYSYLIKDYGKTWALTKEELQ